MSLPDQLTPMINRAPASSPAPAARAPITTPAQIDQLLAKVDELVEAGFISRAQHGDLRIAITRAAEKRGITNPPEPTGRDGLPH
jgi:hypothetical protein